MLDWLRGIPAGRAFACSPARQEEEQAGRAGRWRDAECGVREPRRTESEPHAPESTPKEHHRLRWVKELVRRSLVGGNCLAG